MSHEGPQEEVGTPGEFREAWADLPLPLRRDAIRAQVDWGQKSILDFLVYLKDGEYLMAADSDVEKVNEETDAFMGLMYAIQATVP